MLPELHTCSGCCDRGVPWDLLLCLTGNPFAPVPQSWAGRTDSAFASSPGGNNWFGNDGGGGQMVLHNITVLVRKLTRALF